MSVVSMKQLLEAGVHFGHQTRRWNPKMAEYIYCERNGIYIIDLAKTVKKLEEAYDFVRDLAANGQSILFVGTKKQATDSVKEEASRVGMHYVNARWLGGMLTNFKTMRTRVERLNQLHKMQEEIGDIWADVAKGDLSKVTDWLRSHIHRYASFKKPGELFESVCGKFDAKYYTDYLTEKYTKLYGL